MAKFLVQVSYSPDGAKGLRKDGGTRRVKVVSKAVESIGGTVESFYFSFGTYDAVLIVEAPDNASAAGFVIAIAAGGALSKVETTVLMTVEETLEALAKSKSIGYRRPGE